MASKELILAYEVLAAGNGIRDEEGRRCQLRLRYGASRWLVTRRLKSVSILLPFRADTGMKFRWEKDYDTWAVKWRISSEPQIGEPGFDRHVFIDCDDQDFVQRFLEDEERREAIRDLLRLGAKEISIGPEGFYIDMGVDFFDVMFTGPPEAAAKKRLGKVLALAAPLFAPLSPYREDVKLPGHDYFQGWFLNILIAFLFLWFMGMGGVFRRGAVVPYESVLWPYWQAVWVATPIVWALYIWLGRKTTHKHRTANKVAIGFFLIVGLMAPLYANLNRWLGPVDEGELIAVEVLGRDSNSRGRGHRSYSLKVRNWRHGSPIELAVHGNIYRRAMSEPACYAFRLRTGYFGYQYVDELELYKKPKDGGCERLAELLIAEGK